MKTRLLLLTTSLFLLGAASGPPTFESLDTNHDGYLGVDEVMDAERLDRLDTDNDQLVSKHEFRRYLGALPAPPRVEKIVHRDLPYYDTKTRRTRGATDLARVTLDVYQPVKGKSLPVVLFVHGGSWQRGDKRYVGYKPDYFLAAGFVFASTNYRFRPHVSIETLQQDVAAAVAWLHEHAVEYGGDPDNIFLIGHSAGAHQVSMVGTRADLLGGHGLDLSAIRGVVELDTMALDVPLMMETGSAFYGPIFGTDPEELTEVSPWHHIQAERQTPPFMFIVADGNQGKLRQSQRMARKLKGIGTPAVVVVASNRTHGTVNLNLGGIGDEYGPEVVAFFRKYLR